VAAETPSLPGTAVVPVLVAALMCRAVGDDRPEEEKPQADRNSKAELAHDDQRLHRAHVGAQIRVDDAPSQHLAEVQYGSNKSDEGGSEQVHGRSVVDSEPEHGQNIARGSHGQPLQGQKEGKDAKRKEPHRKERNFGEDGLDLVGSLIYIYTSA
jgi:hypothetical protein